MNRLSAGALLVPGVVLSHVATQWTAAGAGPNEAPGTLLSQYSEAEQRDLALVAKTKGISIEQAANDVGWQNGFALFATEIEQEYPESFAGASIDDPSTHVASIAFSGPVPVDVIVRANEFDQASVKLVADRPWSIQELDDRLIAAHAAIARRQDLVSDASSTYDPETGAITVEVRPRDLAIASDEKLTQDLIQTLVSLVPDSIRTSVATIKVRADMENEPQAVVGGGRIEDLAGGLRCSGGFTIKHSSQETGLATAGHCPDTYNTYENYDGDTEVTMNFGGGGPGGDWGDFQWHRVNGTETDDFYANVGELRDIAAIAHPVDNQTLCRYGQSWPADCADVQDLSACTSGNADGQAYDVCRLVRTDNDISDNGDSGGPWYWGNTAYGIHWGVFGTWLGDRSAFSRVMYIYDAINAAILR